MSNIQIGKINFARFQSIKANGMMALLRQSCDKNN